ncbi:1,4-alpha-glucan branching protein GlgB [Daejeonella oryzae]|uniref:1,4-alpha-glucan branching protein GlgB n=1 Tax=Daejeonella oryzae TaxID=1122943 RepID=UPI00041FFC23|nr:1,4-alpha-glucan branching protein GlgB [Daejeonella oryzae]
MAKKVNPAKSNPATATPEERELSYYTRFTDFDINLFKAGKHYKLYEKLGSHVVEHEGAKGTYFAVWAPNARSVNLMAGFNGWDRNSLPMKVRWDGSGIWEIFVPHTGNGDLYKYFIIPHDGDELEKGDPFALRWEEPPLTASMVWDTWYEWNDQKWMKNRFEKNGLNKPFSVYEIHFGSWARGLESPDEFLSYRDMAAKLIPYMEEMNFTHVEFMPIMEHPFSPSWGYQVTGYFSPSSRFGTPQDFMFLIESLHNHGIGVILDWVPSHFPGDAHGLYRFDGSHLFEHADMRKGFHPDWKSYIFNYGRNEIRAFLISNAIFWLDRYHADGIRVDAVASMLYLDYSRKAGEWVPNEEGGRENLEAISFLKEFNEVVYANFPDVQTIAEESTAFPGVSKPTFLGGLGFGMKWMMGWMNDTISYFEQDPYFRRYYHSKITFSTEYAFTENFMLPLSHDEVVHGKGSLLNKMPGDEWQKFANLRLLYLYMFTHPGTKLLFMGNEIGQSKEWTHDHSIDWHLLEHAPHQGLKEFVKNLNKVYRDQPGLYQKSFTSDGFEWIENTDAEASVLVYLRKGNLVEDELLIVLNMTPVPRDGYRVGAPLKGKWQVILNSDMLSFYGSGIYQDEIYTTEAIAWQGKPQSIVLNLPPLSGLILKQV